MAATAVTMKQNRTVVSSGSNNNVSANFNFTTYPEEKQEVYAREPEATIIESHVMTKNVSPPKATTMRKV